MHQVIFPSGTVNYYFSSSVLELQQVIDKEQVVFVTDENVLRLYPAMFASTTTLVVSPGEDSKDITSITRLAAELLDVGATRSTLLLGVGGGVVTDITGLLASVYMRGVRFGFVPTTLLAMTDAAIGGKNGVNMGLHKNILGTIRQPEFIIYDNAFLQTLPTDEWSNGFAEVIKYAAIFDKELFEELSNNSPEQYKTDSDLLDALINRCVAWKNKTVVEDEREAGGRKLLNFGHTAGHAIEKLYGLSHGKAVAIGMMIASLLSEATTGLSKAATKQLADLLMRYQLPTHIAIDTARVMEVLKADKKRKNDTIDYILLEQIGEAIIQPLQLADIEHALNNYESNHSSGTY